MEGEAGEASWLGGVCVWGCQSRAPGSSGASTLGEETSKGSILSWGHGDRRRTRWLREGGPHRGDSGGGRGLEMRCCLSLQPLASCPWTFGLLGLGLEAVPVLGFSLLTPGSPGHRGPPICRVRRCPHPCTSLRCPPILQCFPATDSTQPVCLVRSRRQVPPQGSGRAGWLGTRGQASDGWAPGRRWPSCSAIPALQLRGQGTLRGGRAARHL